MSTPNFLRKIATATAVGLCIAPANIQAQEENSDAATIAILREQVAELTRRLDELERRQTAEKPEKTSVSEANAGLQKELKKAQAATKEARAAVAEMKAAQREMQSAPGVSPQITPGSVAGLDQPEEMGSSYSGEDALRSDLPGIALRIPNTDTEARVYGFAKVTSWHDFEGRNQSDVPAVQTIPLNGSNADLQGGDFGMSARFSRIGTDTRTLTDWGTLETRLEGDFGGGNSTSATFRLRQAWAEVGTDEFSVLLGQANSLWNEGVFETLIDSTNLNQSFVRQAQIRLTSRLAEGLTGQFSMEAPDTTYTSFSHVVNPNSVIDGGASPALNTMPDFLGRLTYRQDGMELSGRTLLRNLTINTEGTAVTPGGEEDALGWGFAGQVRVPMRWLADEMAPDELIAMAYYGEGIGRYFAGNTSSQDAISNLGMAGVVDSFSLDTVESLGMTVAYRRFWTPTLRSNFAYSYARNDYPEYARNFAPGTASATSLNSDMGQIFINLIWSPFGTISEGVFRSGWLDLGLEYLYSERELFGGAAAAGAGDGEGEARRLLFGGVARF